MLFLSQRRGLRHWMETSPLAERLTSRFIAGNTLDQELAVCRNLSAEGILATLDHLGESVTSLAEAERSRDSGRRDIRSRAEFAKFRECIDRRERGVEAGLAQFRVVRIDLP